MRTRLSFFFLKMRKRNFDSRIIFHSFVTVITKLARGGEGKQLRLNHGHPVTFMVEKSALGEILLRRHLILLSYH